MAEPDRMRRALAALIALLVFMPARAAEPPSCCEPLADLRAVGSSLQERQAWLAIGIGAGITVVSSALDRRGDRWAQDRAGEDTWRALRNVGNNVHYAGFITSAVMATPLIEETRLRHTAFTSLEAGIAVVPVVAVLKHATGRASPYTGQGPGEFTPGDTSGGHDSFPSFHVAASWALVTPYAKEYDLPWLYGVAALSNVARMVSRDHWVSDTIGGALIGYGTARLLMSVRARERSASAPGLVFTGDMIALYWRF